MNIKTSEFQQLLQVIRECNLSVPEVIDIIKGNDAVDKQAKSTEEIKLIVDYSQTVKQMIEAGKYDCIVSDITEKHFPLPSELFGERITVSSKLFHFNRDITSKDVIVEMEEVGYHPAILPELLALGKARPELQRQFPIIALGSIWRDSDCVRYTPGLRVSNNGRKLNLYWFSGDWNAYYRFLGIRN